MVHPGDGCGAAARPVASARFELAQGVEQFGRDNVADQLFRSGPCTVPAGLDLGKELTKATARNRFAQRQIYVWPIYLPMVCPNRCSGQTLPAKSILTC
jgi:hypothetical protein